MSDTGTQGESAPGAPTRRGRERRERIIEAAIDLFHAKGYHATGIDDIGEAAGISGPGVYRHFASKDDILMTIFDRVWMMFRAGIDKARSLEPRAAMETLVDTHVSLAVERRAMTSLLLEELRSLPDDYRAKARKNEAVYRDAWARTLVRWRPEVDFEDALLVSRACFWLINSIDVGARSGTVDSAADPGHVKSLLTTMTFATLESV